jgi:hypothetical protein
MEWPAKGQLRLRAPTAPVQSGWWNRAGGALGLPDIASPSPARPAMRSGPRQLEGDITASERI